MMSHGVGADTVEVVVGRSVLHTGGKTSTPFRTKPRSEQVNSRIQESVVLFGGLLCRTLYFRVLLRTEVRDWWALVLERTVLLSTGRSLPIRQSSFKSFLCVMS